jgi:UDP-N-acetyl-D-galactosamine dehydrogenase
LNTVKVVAGDSPETLARAAALYGQVVEAELHLASSIKVAEASKVIENTQRDLNIALMNELALIFDRIGIRTLDVIDAAATKWNFLRFTPGLVGGHCIGVDPYYLTTKAEELGYKPRVILAGRGINNEIGAFVAQKTVKMLTRSRVPLASARVAVLGLTFKENVPDLRNSKVCDILTELDAFGITPMVHDAMGSPAEARAVYGVDLGPWEEITALDAVMIAGPNDFYTQIPQAELLARVNEGGVVVDVKSALDPAAIDRNIAYWSL